MGERKAPEVHAGGLELATLLLGAESEQREGEVGHRIRVAGGEKRGAERKRRMIS